MSFPKSQIGSLAATLDFCTRRFIFDQASKILFKAYTKHTRIRQKIFRRRPQTRFVTDTLQPENYTGGKKYPFFKYINNK